MPIKISALCVSYEYVCHIKLFNEKKFSFLSFAGVPRRSKTFSNDSFDFIWQFNGQRPLPNFYISMGSIVLEILDVWFNYRFVAHEIMQLFFCRSSQCKSFWPYSLWLQSSLWFMFLWLLRLCYRMSCHLSSSVVLRYCQHSLSA